MNSANKRALRIVVDLGAIQHNFNVARRCSHGQKIFAVVKADAYGHGAVVVANALEGADAFAVVTVNEAVELREGSINKPILVLQGPQSQADCETFLQHKLWPVVHCEEQLQWFADSIDTTKLQPWLKVDTGMGRLGFLPERAQALLSENAGVNWFGVLTHFAMADELDNPITKNQIDNFNLIQTKPTTQKSLANSAGLLAWPDAQADWARPGIMLYGANPILNKSDSKIALHAAMRVSAPLISRKQFSAGSRIGYGGTYRCPESMPIGYIAIGYGDGLPRVLDDSACVWVAGQRCPIVGRVSMDSIAVDLRGLDHIELGAEVVLWGPEHSVDVMASAANTISYELLTSIKGVRTYIN